MKQLVIAIVTLLFITSVSAQNESQITNEQLLELYEGLRVTDISDGMDMMGLMNTGLMEQSIAPLWKDIEAFRHHITGIALTVKYVPSQKSPVPDAEGVEAYRKWRDHWYTYYSGEPFIQAIEPGNVIVIENPGDGKTDCGTVGSNNSMVWQTKGSVGVISSGGIRDMDEVIKQRIPVYTDYSNRGRGIRPGRNELESYNEPIVVGGVYIQPGDVVVADTDGVIVVPRDRAIEVADAARKELNIDKSARRKLYKQLGIPLDFTVEE